MALQRRKHKTTKRNKAGPDETSFFINLKSPNTNIKIRNGVGNFWYPYPSVKPGFFKGDQNGMTRDMMVECLLFRNEELRINGGTLNCFYHNSLSHYYRVFTRIRKYSRYSLFCQVDRRLTSQSNYGCKRRDSLRTILPAWRFFYWRRNIDTQRSRLPREERASNANQHSSTIQHQFPRPVIVPSTFSSTGQRAPNRVAVAGCHRLLWLVLFFVKKWVATSEKKR